MICGSQSCCSSGIIGEAVNQAGEWITLRRTRKPEQHSPKVLSGVIEMVYKLMTTELAKIHSSHHQLIIGCDCLISGRSNSVSFVRDCCLLGGGHIVPVLFYHLLEICGAHCPCFIWRYAIPFWQIARDSCIVSIQFCWFGFSNCWHLIKFCEYLIQSIDRIKQNS